MINASTQTITQSPLSFAMFSHPFVYEWSGGHLHLWLLLHIQTPLINQIKCSVLVCVCVCVSVCVCMLVEGEFFVLTSFLCYIVVDDGLGETIPCTVIPEPTMPTQISSAKVVLDGQKSDCVLFIHYTQGAVCASAVVLLLIRDAHALMDRKDGCLWLYGCTTKVMGAKVDFGAVPI